jgi:dienelactone hydrolase
MYLYDRTPLRVKTEAVAQDSPHWRREKVTIDAAYGNERLPIYLYLPVNVRPPYQTVVFYPSARVLASSSSDTLGDLKFFDYVVQSGRAVMYPVYKGTYERPAVIPGPDTVAGRDTIIQGAKDIGRAIDYAETRADLDRNRIAYLGVSMGAALGPHFGAVEQRFKALVLFDGGYYVEKPLPGADQADFAPRVKAPTLMLSGKFDWIFLGKDAMLRLFGTPAADKKAVTLETAHDVSEKRDDMARETLAWLDRYLGKVN